ncbi:hypothetical protein AB6A40_008022 [Gnathostoma spinigerum]|uniref:F-box domain-containing protein n=1 Tax=Gnathostoma spinigerum TaxID=75299 RepID=A0ABD6EW77_9BILA
MDETPKHLLNRLKHPKRKLRKNSYSRQEPPRKKQCSGLGHPRCFPIQNLPYHLIFEVVQNLSYEDLCSFSISCRQFNKVVSCFWKSQQSFNVHYCFERIFPNVNQFSLRYLHCIRKKMSRILYLIPPNNLRSVDLRPIAILDSHMLDSMAALTKKSPSEIFGAVRYLDLRDILLSFREFQWFAVASPNLTLLRITGKLIDINSFPDRDNSQTKEVAVQRMELEDAVFHLKSNLTWPRLQLITTLHHLFPKLSTLDLQ